MNFPTSAPCSVAATPQPTSSPTPPPLSELGLALVERLRLSFEVETNANARLIDVIAHRIAVEVDRICHKSDRIQNSGDIESWYTSLAQHRLRRCLEYYRLGSRQGRVELHSRLSAISYRYISPNQMQLGFQGRCTLLEDFLQGFYIEVLKAFRRENYLPNSHTPHTRLELAEYMAFSEQYAKRRINLPGCYNQQLVVLRAQAFAKRLPQETAVDIELAVDSAKTEEGEIHARSSAVQQLREKMVADASDPTETVLRDRVVQELIQYLQAQDQEDCVDYLTLRLQDMPACEIDEILGLTARQRDYLQQRFKYHVEKFAQVHHWQLVHQWLGADLDQNLGLAPHQWAVFIEQLQPDQRHLLDLKQMPEAERLSDKAIAQTLQTTPKRVQRQWGQILALASKCRNQAAS
jgi:hypothetical protein